MSQKLKGHGFLEKMIGPVSRHAVETSRWAGDAVRIHLNELLNTRRGSVVNLPDYGVPDMASFFSDYPASMATLRSEIQDLISKYEPRLLGTHVRILETGEGEFRVSFLITGEIEDDDGSSAFVKYRTTISSNGQVAFGHATATDGTD